MSTGPAPDELTRQPTLDGPPSLGATMLRRAALVLAGLVALLVLLVAAGAVWLHGTLEASLPVLDGTLALPGLSAPVRIERDASGVPKLTGEDRTDLARATGYLHAQERFFQMDLMRRRAAGELAELLGAAALEADREVRVHGFRAVADRVLAAAGSADRDVIEAYTAGVNAGLAALGAAPFEYVVLRSQAAPWSAEDSVLAVLSMYLVLQDSDGSLESALGVMHDVLPQELFDFLAPIGTEWDAPVIGEPWPAPPIPGPEIFDLRRLSQAPAEAARRLPSAPHQAAGSNNWAVAGAHTTHGGALLANDIHLGLAVPNTWYRLALSWPDDGGGRHLVVGVTLPGVPNVVVGSNTRVAWGFTNSYGDWSDLVVLEQEPDTPDTYMTPGGPRRIERRTERIPVRDGDDVELEVLTTIWGPVIDEDHRGQRRAYRWVAHEERATGFSMLRLETAASLDDALAIGAAGGIPAQNLVCADASGRVGWTILGSIPRRVGFDGRLPASWADGSRSWDGWLSAAEHPRIVDPAAGRVWTANARVVEGEMLASIGDGGYAHGARASQIRDRLLATEKADEAAMLALQLDDRALFLQRWRELLLDTLTADAVASAPERAELRRLVEESWDGRASVDSVGFRLVRTFRLLLAQQVLEAITAGCEQADPRFSYRRLNQMEGPLWALVTQRPIHLLDPTYESWEEQLLAAADATVSELTEDRRPLAGRTWGERNTAAIQHPLARAMPLLSAWLDMPRQPLPGDGSMPRVQSAAFGASERMVVSPGREAEGIFHMPCGQSGHPLSPFYRAGHDAWVRGEPTPLLPGPAAHTLTLTPALSAER